MHPDVARRQEHPLAPPTPADFAAHEKDRSRQIDTEEEEDVSGGTTSRSRSEHDVVPQRPRQSMTTRETLISAPYFLRAKILTTNET